MLSKISQSQKSDCIIVFIFKEKAKTNLSSAYAGVTTHLIFKCITFHYTYVPRSNKRKDILNSIVTFLVAELECSFILKKHVLMKEAKLGLAYFPR